MKSILVLASTYPRWMNDTEPRFVHDLCKQLTSEYRVIALVPHYPGASRKQDMDGVLVHRFRYFLPVGERLAYDGGIIQNLKRNRLKLLLVPFFLISQFIQILVLCRKYNIKLIHAHWVIPQGLLALLARPLLPGKIKVLSTSHGGDLFSLQGGFLQSLKRFTFRHSDHVTVVSRAMRSHLINMGCSSHNISVQSMGVGLTTQFVPDKHAAKTRDIIFVGRLVEKKGVSTLIGSINLLKKSYPELTVALVGDGPERPDLAQQCRQLGVNEQVEFLGSMPNDRVPQFYQSAKIAVVPSIVAADGDQEGLGLVAVEAMGCGCATIVSDLPALRDVVIDGENGLAFKAGDEADLAEKISTLMRNPELSARLGLAGHQSVIDKFDWHTVGARYLGIMDQCLRTKDG